MVRGTLWLLTAAVEVPVPGLIQQFAADITKLYDEYVKKLGWDGYRHLMSVGVGEILLAAHKGHRLQPGAHGPDAFETIGDQVRKYEYKVGASGSFVFAFGARAKGRDRAKLNRAKIKAKLAGVQGVICATHRFGRVDEVWEVDAETFTNMVLAWSRKTKAQTLRLTLDRKALPKFGFVKVR